MITYKNLILSKLVDYLKYKQFKLVKRGKLTLLNCPFCNTNNYLTANIIPNTSIIYCHKCKKRGNLIDIVKLTYPTYDEERILDHVNKELNLNLISDAKIKNILNYYHQNGFDLVPIVINGKAPIEKEWTKKEHKDPQEWLSWLDKGLNIGVKCGKMSNITIIDIDNETIPDILNVDTLKQKTNRGWHLFFKYEVDLPKVRIDDIKIDIENDGGQVVIAPSIIDGFRREINFCEIIKMPKEIKEFLLSKLKNININNDNNYEKALQNILKTDFNLSVIEPGNRNNFLIHFGGLLRKQLSLSQTNFVLNIINKHFCKPSLPQKEINNILRSLEKYMGFDEKELANKVLNYLKITDEATKIDIRQALDLNPTGKDKERLDNVISYLCKEGFVIKRGRGRGTYYHIVKRANWRDTFIDEIKEINFKMPYFDDIATFRDGDLIILGGKPKVGKSIISMNIIKRLVDQGIKPYYLNLESGNRFMLNALSLGLKEGDFYWDIHFNPEQIELEKNVVTIIDWISPENYAETDKLFKHFAEQLVKNNGILIAMVQLRENGKFFAQDLIKQFPAFIARYFYDNDEDGSSGYFLVDYIREPKINRRIVKIPCRYFWQNKELKRVDELENECILEKEN